CAAIRRALAEPATKAATPQSLVRGWRVRGTCSCRTALAALRPARPGKRAGRFHYCMEGAHGLAAGDARPRTVAHGAGHRRTERMHADAAPANHASACGKEIRSSRRTQMKFSRVFFILLVLSAGSWAQKPGDDPIAQALFPPELVMKYHQEINLD